MKKYDLNELPKLMATNQISQKETINYLAEFILENKPLFELQLYDEDFTSEIILKFLENSDKFLNNYNSQIGTFSGYFYSYIIMTVHSEKKSKARKILENTVYCQDIIISMDINKNHTDLQYMNDKPRVPYKFNTISVDDFKTSFQQKIENTDKKILVSALRSAFDISDAQIDAVSKIYQLDPEILFQIIQYCKKGLDKKVQRRNRFLERRNSQFFFQRKYELQLKSMDEIEYITEPEQLKLELERKKNKHKNSWKNSNMKLKNGYLYLRPSTKVIADLLGICERQVCYYLYCIKHNPTEDKEEEKSLPENK